MVNPYEALCMVGVMNGLTERGYTEHFMLRGGQLRGARSGKIFAPHQVAVAEVYRFEGVSDPDDMAILYALEARGGVRGTLTDAYGVYSDPAVGAFMADVPAVTGSASASPRTAVTMAPRPIP